MRTDASVTNGDPGLGEPSRECPTVAQLVELLQTAYPINWEQLLRNRLDALGVADPADLRGPAETTATIVSDAGGPCSSIQDGTCRRGCRGPPFRRR